jgi:2-oxoglutarate ferredoxin oxidoreductase subunit beta
MGVFRAVQRPVYHELMHAQIDVARKANGEPDLAKLVRGSKTWTVA